MYNIFTELASKLYNGNKNYSNSKSKSKSNKIVYIPTSQYQLSKEIRCTLLLPYTNKCIKNPSTVVSRFQSLPGAFGYGSLQNNKINNQITKIVERTEAEGAGERGNSVDVSRRSLNDYHTKNNKNIDFFTGTKIVVLGSFTLFCFYLFNKRK